MAALAVLLLSGCDDEVYSQLMSAEISKPENCGAESLDYSTEPNVNRPYGIDGVTRLLPHRASACDRSAQVRPARDDEPGLWTWEFDGRSIPVDVPSDFTAAVDRGVEVTIDYARFSLIVWRGADGALRYRAVLGAVAGPERRDEELALWALLEQLGDTASPRACFFCRWSDVEPGSGWGNLGCFVAQKVEYDAIATSEDNRRRKWVTSTLPPVWVDEWYACDQFEVRPIGYGYRGRPDNP
jgi:hypothetical protein